MVKLAAFLDAPSVGCLTSARFFSCEEMRQVNLGLNPPPPPRLYDESAPLDTSFGHPPALLQPNSSRVDVLQT